MADDKKVIYISHPYGGKQYNESQAASLVLYLMKKYPNYLFISPVHAFSFAYKELEYEKGLRYCLDLLDMCQEMWVADGWENSVGCNRESEYCKSTNKPYYFLGKDYSLL